MAINVETSQGFPLRISSPVLMTEIQSFLRPELARLAFEPAAFIEESLLTFLGLLSYERTMLSR